jgi:hypothetical protein
MATYYKNYQDVMNDLAEHTDWQLLVNLGDIWGGHWPHRLSREDSIAWLKILLHYDYGIGDDLEVFKLDLAKDIMIRKKRPEPTG